MLSVSHRLYCNVDLAISNNNKMQMKNKKNAAEVFLFQRNDLSLQSKIEPLHIVVTKTVK